MDLAETVSKTISHLLFQSPRVAITHHHKLDGLSQRNLFSQLWRPETPSPDGATLSPKVPRESLALPFPASGGLLGCLGSWQHNSHFCLYLHVALSFCVSLPVFFFLKVRVVGLTLVALVHCQPHLN